MERVGVGLRAAATLIDVLVLGFIGFVLAKFTGGTTSEGFQLQGAPAFLFFVVALGYYTVMEALLGWTVGKRLIGLRVVKLEGGPIDWQASIIRNVLRVIDGLFFYLVAAIVVWTTGTKQRLGDRLANTVVVRSP